MLERSSQADNQKCTENEIRDCESYTSLEKFCISLLKTKKTSTRSEKVLKDNKSRSNIDFQDTTSLRKVYEKKYRYREQRGGKKIRNRGRLKLREERSEELESRIISIIESK
jgi:hypothetical protein